MKTTNRYLSAVIALAVVVIVVFLALDLPGSALPTDAFAPLLAPTPPPGEPIPLKSLEELDSLSATVRLDVNGLIDGKRVQGDMTGLLDSNNQNKSRIALSGDLIGELAAEVGGSLVGLFTPSEVDLYRVPQGTFIAVGGLLPICVKPKALNEAAALDEMSPQSLLAMLTSPDVARGKLVGEEKLNGVPVKHYVINGEAFLAAAQKSKNPKLRAFGEGLWSAEDADLYVDAKSGYPVAFRGNYSGLYAPIKFEGDFGVQIELTGINTNPRVELPAACNKPISQ